MASNALVTITYQIPEEKQAQYRKLISALADRINHSDKGIRLTVFASQDDPSQFTEVYECESVEVYEALEDSLDEEARTAIRWVATELTTGRQTFNVMRRVV